MFTVNYTLNDYWQSPQSKNERDMQNNINLVLDKEKRLISLQEEYIEEVDRYYSDYPPFSKLDNTRPPENQEASDYVRLIWQCMYSNNIYLLRKWGIDYIQQKNVLTKPKKFYSDIFKKFSNPDKCMEELRLGVIAASYFSYLYENFPKTE